MGKTAVFPGSFDPYTLGHHNVITRALPLFDKIIIALGQNTSKTPAFEPEARLKAIRSLYANVPAVEVVTFTGLTVELCRRYQARYIIRGLRNGIDFEYEKAIAGMNKKMYPELETIFIVTEPVYEAISSTIVREIYKSGGDIAPFLPEGFNLTK